MVKQYLLCAIVLVALTVVGCATPAPQTPPQDATFVDISSLINGSSNESSNASVVVKPIEQPTVQPATEIVTEPVKSSAVKELPTVIVVEGETVSFPNLKAVDPDGDTITYTFSSPLDSTGTWTTKIGDAGSHDAIITASDGTNIVNQTGRIVVNPPNQKPVLERIADLRFKEGENVQITPKALDPEGSSLTFSYTGWMTSESKQTGYSDSGDYTVTVTVSDGVNTVSQDVKITVEDVNRAPVFESII